MHGLAPGECRFIGVVEVCKPPASRLVFVGTASEAAAEGVTPSSLSMLLHVPPLQAPRLGLLARAVELALKGHPVYSPDEGRLYTVVASALEASGMPPPLAWVEASEAGVSPVTLVQRHVVEAYYHARRLGLLGAVGDEVAEYAAVMAALRGLDDASPVMPAASFLADAADYMVHGMRLVPGDLVGVYISAPRMHAGSRVDASAVVEACRRIEGSGGRYGLAVKACRVWPPFSISEA